MANCAKQKRRVADYFLKFGCEALTFGKLLGRLWTKVQLGPLKSWNFGKIFGQVRVLIKAELLPKSKFLKVNFQASHSHFF